MLAVIVASFLSWTSFIGDVHKDIYNIPFRYLHGFTYILSTLLKFLATLMVMRPFVCNGILKLMLLFALLALLVSKAKIHFRSRGTRVD